GQSATLALKGLSGSGVHEELLDPTGTPLVLGHTGPTNEDEVISDFIAPASGTYYAHITSSSKSPVDYSLVLTVNAGFDTENNDSIATAQNVLSPEVAGGQWVLGDVGNVDVKKLTFDELPFQPVNGLTYQGVTFGFTINGVASTDAHYHGSGPGQLKYV